MMPYKIERRGNQHCVVKKDGSKSFGCHPTRAKAQAQLRAIYANTKE